MKNNEKIYIALILSLLLFSVSLCYKPRKPQPLMVTNIEYETEVDAIYETDDDDYLDFYCPLDEELELFTQKEHDENIS